MNNQRRTKIRKITEKLVDINMDLQDILNEEEEVRDNTPETLQGSDRYQTTEEACDTLQNVIESIDDAITELEEIAN